MRVIPDFTNSELWIVEATLRERYGAKKEIQRADGEIRLRPSDRELTPCPILFWESGSCHFVLIKSGERRYRSQFYYEAYKQYGAGASEYDDITTCVVATLQAQADEEARRSGNLS